MHRNFMQKTKKRANKIQLAEIQAETEETRATLVYATEQNSRPLLATTEQCEVMMCHLSMKLSAKFDPNQMYTSDKIMVKHISVKETLLKLDLEPMSQGHSKQQQLNKNIPDHLLINTARLCLVTVVLLISQTGYE